MKTPDRCRSGTPPSAENGLRGFYFGVWCYRRPTIGASPATFHTVSEGEFSEVRVASVQHESVSGLWHRGYIAPQNGRSRASSMNLPLKSLKYPSRVRYSSPRSSSIRAECGVSLPAFWERWTI